MSKLLIAHFCHFFGGEIAVTMLLEKGNAGEFPIGVQRADLLASVTAPGNSLRADQGGFLLRQTLLLGERGKAFFWRHSFDGERRSGAGR